MARIVLCASISYVKQSCLLHLQLDCKNRTVSPLSFKCNCADVEDIPFEFSFPRSLPGSNQAIKHFTPCRSFTPCSATYPNLINYCLPGSKGSICNSQFERSMVINSPIIKCVWVFIWIFNPECKLVVMNALKWSATAMVCNIQSHREDSRPRAQDRRRLLTRTQSSSSRSWALHLSLLLDTMHTSEYDYLFKLLLIGDSGVGKVRLRPL